MQIIFLALAVRFEAPKAWSRSLGINAYNRLSSFKMNIEKYPSFCPLLKEHKLSFDEAFKKNPPVISEFTFTNLFAWRQAYKFAVSELDGFLIVRSDAKNIPYFFPPVGSGDIKACIEKILNDSRGVLMRAPENIKVLFEGDARFKITFDRDNSDYIYNMEEIASLAGSKYHSKRNLISQFKSSYEYEYIALNAQNSKDCLIFEEKWCTINDCAGIESLNNEREAIKIMLENFGDFGLLGGAIKIKGKICAVAIGEGLNPDTLVMHVLKAEPEIRGLYQVIFNEFLLRITATFRYINLEQDLGVEGLRKSKLSYHPAEIANKYLICLA